MSIKGTSVKLYMYVTQRAAQCALTNISDDAKTSRVYFGSTDSAERHAHHTMVYSTSFAISALSWS